MLAFNNNFSSFKMIKNDTYIKIVFIFLNRLLLSFVIRFMVDV